MSIESETKGDAFRRWKRELTAREPVLTPRKVPAWGAEFPAEVKPRPLTREELQTQLWADHRKLPMTPRLTKDTTIEDFRTIIRFMVVEILNETNRKRKSDQ
jgi:hypothetical protein